MIVVVLEHFTADPRAGSARCAPEGRAMRDAVAADLLALPDVEVVVLHAPGWPPAWPVAADDAGRRRALIVRGGTRAALRAALRGADAALVIAPEEGGTLARLSATVEDAGRLLLGPSSAVVRLAADKAAMGECLAAAGVRVPATEVLRFAGAAPRLATRRPPFIVKPRDGCGGSGVVVVRRRDGVASALAAVRAATARRDFLVQELVAGEAASVSLVARDRTGWEGREDAAETPGAERSAGILPLSLNRQLIRGAARLEYAGGVTPWPHPETDAAMRVAVRAATALAAARPGLRGYLGIDLVLGKEGPVVVDVNPRLTTSYVGLRRVLTLNPAGLILEAARGRPLPFRVPSRGRVRFSGTGRVTSWRSTSAGTSAARI